MINATVVIQLILVHLESGSQVSDEVLRGDLSLDLRGGLLRRRGHALGRPLSMLVLRVIAGLTHELG